MDPRLLAHYDAELKYLRESGLEFAREYPKVAGRLGLDGVEAKECADPYVERLLEGCAFLAARIQLQLKLEYPRFTEQLLQAVYPGFLNPVPSMLISEFRPVLAEAGLAAGARIPRGTVLRSIMGKDEATACEFRTAHAVTLWPLQLSQARYYGTSAGLGLAGLRDLGSARAGLRLSFTVTAGLKAAQLALDQLDIYLSGVEQLPRQLHEHLFAHAVGFVIRARDGTHLAVRGVECIQPLGFDDSQALLSVSRRTFSGYRLLQEYFALPERFLFVRLDRLRAVLSTIEASEFEIIVLFNRPIAMFESLVTAENFRLNATPAINLIERRADRIHLADRTPEYHLVVDRVKPMDFEVCEVLTAEGFGNRAEPEVRFQPFYGATEAVCHAPGHAYFTLRREQRLLSPRQRRFGPRTSYIGQEVYVSLTDSTSAPFSSDLRQLECTVSCTNRDLPLQMTIGRGKTDFQVDSGAPVESIRVTGTPTKPREALALAESAWRLISHLSLNYASLLENSATEGATALREMLSLYAIPNDPVHSRQIEGVRGIATRPVMGRLPVPGPVAIGRGLELSLTLDDRSFEGSGPYLLGTVLEQFFARYVSINSFTQTVLRTVDRGEIGRWPPRTGRRSAL